MTDMRTDTPTAATNFRSVNHSAFEAASDIDLRTDLRVEFAGKLRRFYLGDAEILKLEFRLPFGGRGCPVGERTTIGAIYRRLCAGRAVLPDQSPIWSAIEACDPAQANFLRADVSEVIGHGLIGGGLSAADARELVDRYVRDAPLAPSWQLAFAILGARMFGRQADAGDDGGAGKRRGR